MLNDLAITILPTSEPAVYEIPPSFHEAPVLYGFALLADLLATMLCLAVLLRIATEARRLSQAELMSGTPFRRAPGRNRLTLSSANALILSGLLLTIICRAGPDAMWMIALGEVSRQTLSSLFRLDYFGDFLALGFLLGSVILWAWTRQSIPQQLYKAADIPLAPLNREIIREGLKITGLVTLISIILTIAKANA